MWKNFILIGLPLLLAQTPAVPLEFSAACSPPAHQRFIQGIVKLHNSAFREAGEHFRAAQQIDGDCVMAYWGEAMASSGEQDIAGGRRALLKLGPARAARAAKAASARERGYLNAVEVLLGEGDRNTRDFRYAGVMQKLAFDNPLDYEASAFYAAAIIATFRIGDPDLSKRKAAGSILELILKKYPDHPGALHSFIHAYDHPELAHLALGAARHYERVAGEDFHALHTPAHAYVQLGMWADAVRANEAAFEVSRRYVQRNKLSVARLDYHSLEWLQYAELQSGMYQRAMSRTDMVLKSAAETRVTGMTVLAAEMASRFAVETAQWDALAPFSQNLKIPKLLFAQGIAALQKGDLAGAQRNITRLDVLIQESAGQGQQVRATQTDVLKRQLSAAIALHQQRFSDAEGLASEAVELESALRLPSVLGQSSILKPATEFYAEILLKTGKPAEAAEQFEAALKSASKRPLSLLGLGRARAAQGNAAAAREAYRTLASIWLNADPSIPSLQEIRTGSQQ